MFFLAGVYIASITPLALAGIGFSFHEPMGMFKELPW
jgi:hypothetical protein